MAGIDQKGIDSAGLDNNGNYCMSSKMKKQNSKTERKTEKTERRMKSIGKFNGIYDIPCVILQGSQS